MLRHEEVRLAESFLHRCLVLSAPPATQRPDFNMHLLAEQVWLEGFYVRECVCSGCVSGHWALRAFQLLGLWREFFLLSAHASYFLQKR